MLPGRSTPPNCRLHAPEPPPNPAELRPDSGTRGARAHAAKDPTSGQTTPQLSGTSPSQRPPRPNQRRGRPRSAAEQSWWKQNVSLQRAGRCSAAAPSSSPIKSTSTAHLPLPRGALLLSLTPICSHARRKRTLPGTTAAATEQAGGRNRPPQLVDARPPGTAAGRLLHPGCFTPWTLPKAFTGAESH